MTQFTEILQSVRLGRAQTEQLIPLLYEELRKLARVLLSSERRNDELMTTELVHEAYLRLIGNESAESWENRRHFFGAASRAMRQILIDQARQRNSVKHGGEQQRIVLDLEADWGFAQNKEVVVLNDVLEEFEAVEPQKAQLVQLRYFAGLSESEAAEVMGISRATASRWWTYSRAWLFDRMKADDSVLRKD